MAMAALLLCLLSFSACGSAARLFPSPSSSLSCPIDFSYLLSFPPFPCRDSALASDCCTTLFYTFGIGIALYLRSYGSFELPDNASFASCLSSYRSALLSNGMLGSHTFDSCSKIHSPMCFVQSPLLCSGILTRNDWREKVGATRMDDSCAEDLSDSAVCDACNRDVVDAIQKASSLSIHHSGCIYFAILYAAGVVNRFGPTNPATAACLLATKEVVANVQAHRVAGGYVAVGAAIVIIGGSFLAIFVWIMCLRRQHLYHQKFVLRNQKLLSGSLHPNVGAIWYEFEDLKAATLNFAESNVIGVGGFATVYKGVMADGSQVAVKRIKNCSPEGDAEFANEVDVINSVRHRNLVVLRGCCVASNTNLGHLRLLVYDFMANGSLEDCLFSVKKPLLRWPERMKIVIGAAKGLTYLHTDVQPAIIHRDIKANNILLDEHLNARVADFGLAKVLQEGMTHMTTRVAGTQGYLAPEYALYGQLTEKSDVYGFGVLLLVIVSGRQALDVGGEYPLITDWAWVMVKKGDASGIIDERIRNDGPAALMERFVLVGILCAHLLVALRPTMAQALKMLQGDAEIPEIPDRPLPLTHDSLESSDEDSSLSYRPSEVSPIPQTSKMLSGNEEIPKIRDDCSLSTSESIRSSVDVSSFSSRASGIVPCAYNTVDLLR